jgi:hypothetical protein
MSFLFGSVPNTKEKSKNKNDDILRQLFPDKDAVLIYPDDFGDSPSKNAIIVQELVDRRTGHFSDRRVAILIRPGEYENVQIPVGYWTQVLGLGATPQDTTFRGSLGVHVLPANTEDPRVGSLDTFWRSAENFTSHCEFMPNQDGKWSVSLPAKGNDDDNGSSSNNNPTKLYPVDDLTDPEYGYPAEQIPCYSPQYGMIWAVSQAAPLRRIHVGGNLLLSLTDHCASGGFVSNTHVDGYLQLGSQQQFCVRNCQTRRKATGGAWSFVLTGCRQSEQQDADNSAEPPEKSVTGTITSPLPPNLIQWATKPGRPNPMVVNEPHTPCYMEKPFLFFDGSDNGEQPPQLLYLGIPAMKRSYTGIDHTAMSESERVPILKDETQSQVRVFSPRDPYPAVQEAVDRGCHVVLSPGTYQWNHTLHVTCDNQVLLGIGMATIQAPVDGSPCIHVASATDGVRISGLSLEASAIIITQYEGSVLLQWGEPGQAQNGNADDNPGAMHDLYCFVGGRSIDRTVGVETMVVIHSNHVIGDNLWLWRADHVKLQPNERPNKPELSEYHVTEYGECQCDVGLRVFGNHVTVYGLAVEHTYGDMVEWHGSHGKVYFYQSELPYDVSGDVYQNKSGYHVQEPADHHVAKGVGVYSYFRDHDNVKVPTAVVYNAKEGNFENVFTVWLNGYPGIESVINGKGGPTEKQAMPYVVKTYDGSMSSRQIIGDAFLFSEKLRNLFTAIWASIAAQWSSMKTMLFGSKD